MIVTPPDVPDLESVIDLTARRDNRALQTRIAELENKLASANETISKRVDPLLVETRGEHRTSECKYHPAFFVDEHTRKITCRWCGSEIDPIEVLIGLSKKERHFVHWLEAYRRETQDLKVEIEKLKAERKNLRAAVAAARKKLGTEG